MKTGLQIDSVPDVRYPGRVMDPALVFHGRGLNEAPKHRRQNDLSAAGRRESLGAKVVAPRQAGMKSKEGRALPRSARRGLGLEPWR